MGGGKEMWMLACERVWDGYWDGDLTAEEAISRMVGLGFSKQEATDELQEVDPDWRQHEKEKTDGIQDQAG